MNHRIIFLLIGPLFFSGLIVAQPQIQFEKTLHDFGDIAEGSLVKYDFAFQNTGDQPLVLSRVRASCGCTTPYWTKEPVMPGQTGVISASYNSSKRPGSFNKSISVTSNASTPLKTLYIKGEVISAQNGNYSQEVLDNSPLISLERHSVQLGRVEKGQKIPVDLKVTNNGINDLRIAGVRSACNCVAWENSNAPVKKGEKETIRLVYAPIVPGKTTEEVFIYSNDLTREKIIFYISSEVVESLETPGLLKQNNILKF